MVDGPIDDGWGVSDDYDVTTFYTKGSDGRGHSDNTRVRLKPDVSGEIAALVASGVIPDYHTPQDLMRDAIVHRLRWLSENMDNHALSMKLMEAVRRMVIEETTSRYIALVDAFEEFIGRTREVCERALRFGDHEGVAKFLDDVVEYAENSREPYSTTLFAVADHYRGLLDLSHLDPDVAPDGGTGPDGEHGDGVTVGPDIHHDDERITS